MAKESQPNATIRVRRQFHLRTLLFAVTGFAVACAGLHYLGPGNATALLSFSFGPSCLVLLATVLLGSAVVAHLLAKHCSKQAAGFFLVAVPAIVGLGTLLLVLCTPLSREMATAALTNCFIWPWQSFVVMALLVFPLLVFQGELKAFFEGVFCRRMPFNVLLAWAIVCAFIFFFRCPGLTHAWPHRPPDVTFEFAGMNLVLYLVGSIPIAIAFGPWRFATNGGIIGRSIATVAAIPWGYLTAALLYVILFSGLGFIE